MKKNHLIPLLGILLSFCLFSISSAAVDQKILVYVDGIKVSFPDQQPIINKDNRTLVPVRFVNNALGAGTDWVPKNKEVQINHEAKQKDIKLWVNKKNYTVNGQSKTMDTKAELTKKSRVIVPLRFVSEGLEANVVWQKVDDNGVIHTFTLGQTEEEIKEIMEQVKKEIQGGNQPTTGKLPSPAELGTTTGKEMGLGSLGGLSTNGNFSKLLNETKVMIITKAQLKAQPHQVDGTILYDFWEDKKASDISGDGKIVVKAKLLTGLGSTDLIYITGTNEFHNRMTVTNMNQIGEVTEVRSVLNKPWDKLTISDIKYFGFWSDVSKEILLVKNPEYKGGW